MNHKHYLKQTIDLAIKNVKNNGGPFGALVVDEQGDVIGKGLNKVTASNDPTAHAEVQAIREACRHKESFHLAGCFLYASCEPCPMCLGAIYWARLEQVFYAADQRIAAEGGFDDSFIYEEIDKQHQKRSIPFQRIALENRNLPFEEWLNKENKTDY